MNPNVELMLLWLDLTATIYLMKLSISRTEMSTTTSGWTDFQLAIESECTQNVIWVNDMMLFLLGSTVLCYSEKQLNLKW